MAVLGELTGLECLKLANCRMTQARGQGLLAEGDWFFRGRATGALRTGQREEHSDSGARWGARRPAPG